MAQLVILVFLLWSISAAVAFHTSNQVAKRSSSSECNRYRFGGTTYFHSYICCNNCNDPAGNTCDGVTWQGGSSNDYCSSCGVATGGGFHASGPFSCLGCDQQYECQSTCTNKGFIYDFPGFCWLWANCFQGCCTSPHSGRKRQMIDAEFCGDGVCNGEETPVNCPMDCCYKVNPLCFMNSTGICQRSCCGEAGCCMDQPGGGASATSPISLIVLLSFLSLTHALLMWVIL